MTWDGRTERRRHRRAPIQMWMTFEDAAPGQTGGRPAQLRTLNFGAGGFYGDIDRRLEPLTRLGLRLEFPAFGPQPSEARSIECEAIVVRVDPPAPGAEGCRIAAHFRGLAREQLDYINAFVSWYTEVYAPDPYADGEARDEELGAA